MLTDFVCLNIQHDQLQDISLCQTFCQTVHLDCLPGTPVYIPVNSESSQSIWLIWNVWRKPSFWNPLSTLWDPLDLVSFLRLHSLPAPLRVVKYLQLIWPGFGEYFSCFPDNENDFWRISKIDWSRDIVTSDSDLIQFFHYDEQASSHSISMNWNLNDWKGWQNQFQICS